MREFRLRPGHGYADYLLFVDGKACGVLEAKAEGFTLSGVEPQAQKYAEGLPANLRPPVSPLPFLYIANGGAWSFTNLLDPKPRSRRVFQIHRPETLSDWLGADTLRAWVGGLSAEGVSPFTSADDTRPASLRARIATLPELDPKLVTDRFLFPNQLEAVTHLEHSLKQDRPRALIMSLRTELSAMEARHGDRHARKATGRSRGARGCVRSRSRGRRSPRHPSFMLEAVDSGAAARGLRGARGQRRRMAGGRMSTFPEPAAAIPLPARCSLPPSILLGSTTRRV